MTKYSTLVTPSGASHVVDDVNLSKKKNELSEAPQPKALAEANAREDKMGILDERGNSL
jgi:hypothetical protein